LGRLPQWVIKRMATSCLSSMQLPLDLDLGDAAARRRSRRRRRQQQPV
jgi:hypothetical protein